MDVLVRLHISRVIWFSYESEGCRADGGRRAAGGGGGGATVSERDKQHNLEQHLQVLMRIMMTTHEATININDER